MPSLFQLLYFCSFICVSLHYMKYYFHFSSLDKYENHKGNGRTAEVRWTAIPKSRKRPSSEDIQVWPNPTEKSQQHCDRCCNCCEEERQVDTESAVICCCDHRLAVAMLHSLLCLYNKNVLITNDLSVAKYIIVPNFYRVIMHGFHKHMTYKSMHSNALIYNSNEVRIFSCSCNALFVRKLFIHCGFRVMSPRSNRHTDFESWRKWSQQLDPDWQANQRSHAAVRNGWRKFDIYFTVCIVHLKQMRHYFFNRMQWRPQLNFNLQGLGIDFDVRNHNVTTYIPTSHSLEL